MKHLKLFLSLFIALSQLQALSQCLEGNCENGYGVFQCSCGYLYKGEFKDGKKVHGSQEAEDYFYQGDFKDEMAHGEGEIHYPDSSWYAGAFEQSYPHGVGKYQLASGKIYLGEMVYGDFHGIGSLSWISPEKDTLAMIGFFKDDFLSGLGIVLRNGQMTTIGIYTEDQLNGLGVKRIGNELLVGTFKKSKAKNTEKHSFQSAAHLEKSVENEQWNIHVSPDSNSIYWRNTETSQFVNIVFKEETIEVTKSFSGYEKIWNFSPQGKLLEHEILLH